VNKVDYKVLPIRKNSNPASELHSAELVDTLSALQKEIDHREMVDQQLREAEERYRIIFEQAMDAIILIDPVSAAFLQFNSQACRQLGYTSEEFSRLTLFDIDAQEGRIQLTTHLSRILAHGAETFETVHKTKTGDLRNSLVSARPILLSGTKYLLAIFHDYTERKQIENELRAAVIHLEKNSQAKSEFVANVSHELRTPITSMMYGVRNLLKGFAGPLPDHAIRYLKLFDTECQRLVATINDILDLGKLDNQSLSLSPITAPTRHLILRCIETFRPQTEAAQISITMVFDPGCLFIRCDAGMIQRVLHNILGNAVKFTPRDGTIRMEVAPDPEIGRFARITVTDTGIGIPPEAMPHITERYFKANNQAAGSGLGLAISKDIALLHGGKLTIMSPPGGQAHGTAVSISLPLAEPPTILIVDNDTAILALLRQHLTNQGYQIISAESGQEAILMAEAHRPALVLLDLILEDIHGTTVILTLKSSHTLSYTPIIAVTGATLDEATTDILARFTIPTVAKPWKIGELMDTIETALLGLTAFQIPQKKEPPQ
jgi:PAS domain S-box-containing protein